MPNCPCFTTAIPPNLAVLRQGRALLARLSPDNYTCKFPLVFNASIGGHVRHILEHYESFLGGLPNGAVDYERRARATELERDPGQAGRLIGEIDGRLQRLADEPRSPLLDYRTETAPGESSASSLARELEFLLSHTVHHYALVAVMCRLQGIEPDSDFGVAPSTLRYQEGVAACAR
jgi:uncharacterized damage-inducible protein DinB